VIECWTFRRDEGVVVKPILVIVCLFTLGGCAYKQNQIQLSSEIGSSDIRFSVSAMATFRYYSKQNQPKVFAVTLDGERGFYTYSSADPEKECRDNTSSLLMTYCSERSGNSCKIFAKNGQVVWRDPGLWETTETLGMHFFVDHKGKQSHRL